ncbi:MAG: endonuclease [Kiloniellaceae bacterium]
MFKLCASAAGCMLLVSASAQAACEKVEHEPVDLTEYYADTVGRTGDELKESLNEIIKGHQAYSYTPCVWAILKEADEDPANSANIVAFYTGRSIPKSRQDTGSGDQDSWNREHTWPKSKGFPSKGQDAHTDAHHIRPADRSVNTDRSNNDYANGGEPDDECTGCREGDGTWEPPDAVKGDAARMMFYLVVRYEGNDQSGTPDLELVDRLTHTGEPHLGKLCTLVAWHGFDPVSADERRRNDVIQSWQGNRNPFIDHPEFVQAIWGEECGIGPDDTLREELLNRLERMESEINELRTIIEERM